MNLLLKRRARKPKYTIGSLYIDGSYFCDTLEDADRGLRHSMSDAEIKSVKVAGETAIPTGKYKVLWTYSPRFKKMMPLVNGVPGFSGIRIHSGNTNSDTDGCILLGQNKVVGKVVNSVATIDKFYPIIEKASKKGESIYLEIK